MTDRQTDTVLNRVISPQTQGDQIHVHFWQSYNLHDIRLTQRGFVGAKVFHREHALLTPTTDLRHVVVLWLSPLPQLLRNVVQKLAQEGQEGHILKTH